MFDPRAHTQPIQAEQAPHTFGIQPEQAVHAHRDGMMPVEHPETSRLSDPVRVPPADRDLASDRAQQTPEQPRDIDPEMTIAWGEDPGWLEPAPYLQNVGRQQTP